MDHFDEITIIGMGLIGGSIALALKKEGYGGRITGCDFSKETLGKATAMGAIDSSTEDIAKAVSNADLVVVAVPVGHYKKVLKEMATFLKKGTVVTDVGSVKGLVMDIAKECLPKDIEFLGGHPMAGSEKGGIEAASPYIFENAYYFLTPMEDTSLKTTQRLQSLIKVLGAYPVMISPNEHDEVVAQISHIPHLMAVTLVNMLHRNKDTSYLPFVGGGFRDTTRIASGNPDMWRDIFFFNKKGILKGIETLENILKEFKEHLVGEDKEEILQNLIIAKNIRDRIPIRLKDGIPEIFELIINVEDRPGVIGELTQLIGDHGINIKEIEILHAREGENGVIRIGLESMEQEKMAMEALTKAQYGFSRHKRVDNG